MRDNRMQRVCIQSGSMLLLLHCVIHPVAFHETENGTVEPLNTGHLSIINGHCLLPTLHRAAYRLPLN